MDTGELTLSLVASKHFWCDSDGAGRIGNFRASAGVYVSPSGELILYTTEHDNDGPSDSVRMGEFRHVYTTRPWSPLRCPTADAGGPYVVAEGSSIELSGIRSTPPPEKPWCELYDDKDYSDRSLILDWMDRSRDNFNNFDEHDGFTDKASSVIWQAPVGCDIILYEHDNYEGAALRLAGTGEVRAVPNLDWSDYKFNDKASSIRFDDWEGTGEATAMTFIWDLDGDYNYETPGREVLFSAALIDGPKNCIVRLAVDGAYFPLNDVAETTVEVYNIPPTATIDSMIQPNPHFILPIVHTLTFTGSFTDPGVKDTHTASWDFGDGTVASGTLIEENIAPDSTGAATANHVYSNPGTYTVTLTVTDDDGGFGTDTMQVKVLSAQEAKDLIHQYIQNLEDSAFKGDPTQRKKACVHALKKALSIMFAAIGDMLENEEWNRAIMITDLIRNIADGFVDGTPNNDWIVDPMAQKEICMMIDDLVAYLETFL
jgi:chitodextrinase